MNYTKIGASHIGQKIIMYREPTTGEWEGVGKVSISKVLNVETELTEYTNSSALNPYIRIAIDRYAYPACCFCLLSEFNKEINYELY